MKMGDFGGFCSLGRGIRLLMAKSRMKKLLKAIGWRKHHYPLVKHLGKAMLCTYAIGGLIWWYNETSPLGWWNLKPRPKEEWDFAHLYERRKFPYPGDEEAMREFIAKGGGIGTAVGTRGFIGSGNEEEKFKLPTKKFDQEAQKLWFRMRNEVIKDLQEKGFDVE